VLVTPRVEAEPGALAPLFEVVISPDEG